MFRNYFAAALRNLSRNKLYAALNIGGLAIGFAAAILIALYVKNELSYDRFIPGSDRIYDVYTSFDEADRPPTVADTAPGDFAELFKTDFPFIPAITQLVPDAGRVKQDDVYTRESFYWTQPNFFSVLRLPALAGDLQKALLQPGTVVLTRSMARKYFGRDDARGEVLELVQLDLVPQTMTVTAVIEDLPANTNLTAGMFVSGAGSTSVLARSDAPQPGFGVGNHIFLQLQPGPAMDAMLRDLHSFVHRHKNFRPSDGEIRLELHPLTSVHLIPIEIASFKPYTNPVAVYSLPAVGLLIVLVAGINFVNLMTARASRRGIEVGVRKACGAVRFHLIAQFIGESLLYATVGMLFAVVLVELTLPLFNAFVDRSILFHYWTDPVLCAGMLIVVVLFGVLAGAYPALVLAAFRPIASLHNGAQASGSGAVRQWLVIAQFAVLIGLLLATGVIVRQTKFAMNQALGFDKSQVVLTIPNRAYDAPPAPQTYTNALRALPGVQEVAGSSPYGLGLVQRQSPVTRADGSSISLFRGPVDFGFLEFYARKPIAGRFFSRSYGADIAPTDPKLPWHPPVVINERALHLLGFTTAQSAIGQRITLSFQNGATPSEIIGVAPDLLFGSVRTPVNPMVYYADPDANLFFSVRLKGHDIPATLNAMDDLGKKIAGPYPPPRRFLEQSLQDKYADVTRQGILFALFSGIAVTLSCLGLLGLSSFTAERRTKEIGVRKALGATRSEVLTMLLWQFSKPVLWANLIAWPAAAFAMNRWLHGFAYHIELESWLFLVSAAVALVIALATVSLHSMAVARAKPVSALRYQ
jgi:putative ABC transport system permease protein